MQTKLCTKCKIEKSVTEFTKNLGKKDNLRSWCKKCSINSNKIYFQTTQGKVVSSKSQKKYRKTSLGQEANRRGRKNYKATENGKEVIRVASYRHSKRYPEKVKARREVRDKLKIGKLIKQPCQVCGKKPTEFRIEAHHYLGYEPEHWLDIEWLCVKHHKEADKKLKEIN